MVTATVKINTQETRKELKRMKSQVPFAMSQTLNTIAFNSKKKIDGEIKTKLDRPTRYTQRAINVEKASKRKLTATVKVRGQRKENSVLRHLFSGGGRRGKVLEGKLVGMGVLPRGMFITPGNYARLDSFGNIRKSFITKLVSALQSFKPSNGNVSSLHPGVWIRRFDRAEKKRRKKEGKSGTHEFFVVHKQVNTGGRKRNNSKKPPEAVLLFVDRPRYRQYFDMEKTVNSVLIRDLEREFDKNYQNALRTAR